MPQTRQRRLEELKVELEARFQHICRDMDCKDFEELVEEMAQFRLKYEDLETELQTERLRRVLPA